MGKTGNMEWHAFLWPKVFVIKGIFYLGFDQVFEYFHVHDIAGDGVYGSGDVHDEFIVVTVVVRIGTFPKNGFIFFVVPRLYKQPVGCVKMRFSSDDFKQFKPRLYKFYFNQYALY